jgi:hypothetical protein
MLAITKSEQFLGMLGYEVYEGPYFDGSPKREGEACRVCVRGEYSTVLYRMSRLPPVSFYRYGTRKPARLPSGGRPLLVSHRLPPISLNRYR